jgi:AcrR family transcriptional regulator
VAVTEAGTRERLLAGAITLLEQGGEAAVRVETVAAMAGVARPSLYHFFGDRDGLIVAAQAERYRESLFFNLEFQTEATTKCATRKDFIDLIRNALGYLTNEDGEKRRQVRVEVLGSSVSRPHLRALIAEADQQAARGLGSLLRIAQGRGWLTTTYDLDVAATWWFGMMNGRYLVEGESNSTLVRREWDAIATHTALAVLFGEIKEIV